MKTVKFNSKIPKKSAYNESGDGNRVVILL